MRAGSDPEKPEPIVIEFLGHAGSGKTFFLDAFADNLGEECIALDRFSLSASKSLWLACRHPYKMSLGVRFALAFRHQDWRGLMSSVKGVLAYICKREWAVAANPKYVVASQGLLKILNDMRSRCVGGDRSYTELPLSVRNALFEGFDIVVFIFAPVDVVAKRLILRAGGNASEDEVQRTVEKIRANFHLSVRDNRKNIADARQEHEFRVIEIENAEDRSSEEAFEALWLQIGSANG